MNQLIPRPEHPFPQFERSHWMNLNGIWDFAFDFSKSGLQRGFEKRTEWKDSIVVPFCPESKLSGIGYTDFIPAVWYHRTFTLDSSCLSGKIYLHFGAVDYECHVFINGVEVGCHYGGYSSFQFEISKFLYQGENHLTVYAQDDTRSPLQPSGKQSDRYESYGCFYTRTTGIWQTVWLEFTPTNHILNVQYYPNIADVSLSIRACVSGEETLIASVSYNGTICGYACAKATAGTVLLTIPLSEVYLWEPGKGCLYDLELSFGDDHVKSYFGLREVKLDGYRFLINGKSIFQRLILDQGFYPDGIYTAPCEEALQRDIQLSMDAGFNGARLHQKVFEPRFLYHCDRMGYLVWGEMASWGIDISSSKAYESFLPEWMEVIERDFNHPAIIGWCPFNETWDYAGRRQIDQLLSVTYRLTKQYDTTRPCIDTSGNYHVETDIYDIHDYDQNTVSFSHAFDSFGKGSGLFRDNFADRQQYKPGMPMFVSEYGGIKWSTESNGQKAWGYGQEPATKEEFMARYKGLTETLLNNPKMFGFCYTQLTDVEQEQNGIYTYHREPKMDISAFCKINSQKAAIED